MQQLILPRVFTEVEPLLKTIRNLLNVYKGITPHYRTYGNGWAVHYSNHQDLPDELELEDNDTEKGVKKKTRVTDQITLTVMPSRSISSIRSGYSDILRSLGIDSKNSVYVNALFAQNKLWQHLLITPDSQPDQYCVMLLCAPDTPDNAELICACIRQAAANAI